MNGPDVEREWLVTNGIGGFASGTVAGLNTRRYHGLLVAAMRPPVERTLLVSRLDVAVRYGDVDASLGTNEYLDGTVHPHGYRYLHAFRMDGQTAIWQWLVRDALIEQRVWMAHGQNTTYVSFSLLRASGAVDLSLSPLCAQRDYHSHHRGGLDTTTTLVGGGFEVTAWPGAKPLRVLLEGAHCELALEWHWNHKHRVESARGLDDIEDLFRPALIRMRLERCGRACVTFSAEPARVALADSATSAHREHDRLDRLSVPQHAPPWIRQLHVAADQFIVERRDGAGRNIGKTVIAGYPWFSDWGRDTMIALPGLTLATGRFDVAASILRTFAHYVSEGMIPNRFPDAGETPEYNTVDATLWFIIAAAEYFKRRPDPTLFDELYPVLRDVIATHVRGTRYGIQVDPEDGLLRSGEAGVQLTWMDAKVGDWVVTPRIGKCVEVNALWINALHIMLSMAEQARDLQQSLECEATLQRASRSFRERFWYAEGGYLHDVIDGPEGTPDAHGRRHDAHLRPNQLFALSLPYALLEGERAVSVIDRCSRELWTPVGLRSLAPADSSYVPRYEGNALQRDGAYHQGTVWSWLLGPFALAHYRVHRDANAATALLGGIESHLSEACVGQISEIFDGEPPFAPRGCVAQAWGVAQILQAWSELNER